MLCVNFRFVLTAIAVGLLAAIPAARGSANQQSQTVTVLVAKRSIAVGTVIEDPKEWFKPVRYVKGDEPRGAVTELAKLKGGLTTRPLAEDQPVKERDLISAESRALKAIPKGMRAVSIKVNDLAEGGEFAMPGSRVDLLAIPYGKHDAKVILQNVQILAVNRFQAGRELPSFHTVTVGVMPEQAESLILASHTGLLRLVHRQAKDD